MEERKDVKSMSLPRLTEELTALGEKPFRAKQMYQWMHVRLAGGFEEMTNLSAQLREQCARRYTYTMPELVRTLESGTDGTEKFLFRLDDGNIVESVWMKYQHGNSVCVSSQAGCRMGCRFCASAMGGLARSLLPSEMLEQVYSIQRITGERVSNVVVMGIGEPLDNYENLLAFLRMLTDENGLHISQRSVTVSTCGIVPGIRRLADEGLQITLALSLHSAADGKRRELMPIAEKYNIDELMKACACYFERTGRRITLEYSLLRGINDTDEDAAQLARLAKAHSCHVNLIPANPVRGRAYAGSSAERVQSFRAILEKHKVNVTVRRAMGRDIDGACGQLRRDYSV